MPVIVISLRDGMHHNTNRYCLFCFRVYFLHIQPTSHHIPITHVLHPCSQSLFCPSTPEHNKREVNPTLSWSVAEQLHICIYKSLFLTEHICDLVHNHHTNQLNRPELTLKKLKKSLLLSGIDCCDLAIMQRSLKPP